MSLGELMGMLIALTAWSRVMHWRSRHRAFALWCVGWLTVAGVLASAAGLISLRLSISIGGAG